MWRLGITWFVKNRRVRVILNSLSCQFVCTARRSCARAGSVPSLRVGKFRAAAAREVEQYRSSEYRAVHTVAVERRRMPWPRASGRTSRTPVAVPRRMVSVSVCARVRVGPSSPAVVARGAPTSRPSPEAALQNTRGSRRAAVPAPSPPVVRFSGGHAWWGAHGTAVLCGPRARSRARCREDLWSPIRARGEQSRRQFGGSPPDEPAASPYLCRARFGRVHRYRFRGARPSPVGGCGSGSASRRSDRRGGAGGREGQAPVAGNGGHGGSGSLGKLPESGLARPRDRAAGQ